MKIQDVCSRSGLIWMQPCDITETFSVKGKFEMRHHALLLSLVPASVILLLAGTAYADDDLPAKFPPHFRGEDIEAIIAKIPSKKSEFETKEQFAKRVQKAFDPGWLVFVPRVGDQQCDLVLFSYDSEAREMVANLWSATLSNYNVEHPELNGHLLADIRCRLLGSRT